MQGFLNYLFVEGPLPFGSNYICKREASPPPTPGATKAPQTKTVAKELQIRVTTSGSSAEYRAEADSEAAEARPQVPRVHQDPTIDE